MKMSRLAILLVTLGSFGWCFSDAIKAQEQNESSFSFVCESRNEIPTTLVFTANNPEGAEFIQWRSRVWGSQWSPEARCNAVSNRLSNLAGRGELFYMGVARSHGYYVVCASYREDDIQYERECPNDRIIVTLPSSANPETFMTNFISAVRTVGTPVTMTTDSLYGVSNRGYTYIEMKQFYAELDRTN